MISASKVGSRARPPRRARISVFQSGIFDSGDAPNGGYESLPIAALGTQHLAAFNRQLVITPAALADLDHPGPAKPATLLQAVNKGMQRTNAETHHAGRLDSNQG